MKKRGVVVLGMHRSGTSAVTRVVNLLGPRLGRDDDLYSAPDNPGGHWESVSLCAANDAVLGFFGGTDIRPPRLRSGWERSARARSILPALRSVFDHVYGDDDPYGGEPWLWKDPRLCLTLPIWRQVLSEFCIVLVIRNPTAVADSLHRREGFPSLYCRAVWDWYNRSAVQAVSGLPVAVVDFDAVTEDPAAETARLAERLDTLGVPIIGDPVIASRAVDASVPRRSQHVAADVLTAQTFEILRSLPVQCGHFPVLGECRQQRWTWPLFQAGRVWSALEAPRNRVAAGSLIPRSARLRGCGPDGAPLGPESKTDGVRR